MRADLADKMLQIWIGLDKSETITRTEAGEVLDMLRATSNSADVLPWPYPLLHQRQSA